eukprot:1299412-Amphidinium_carterae.1
MAQRQRMASKSSSTVSYGIQQTTRTGPKAFQSMVGVTNRVLELLAAKLQLKLLNGEAIPKTTPENQKTM